MGDEGGAFHIIVYKFKFNDWKSNVCTADNLGPQEIPPNQRTQRITAGGDSNRWLNISQIVVVQGAGDPDSKIFMCEVCLNRDAQDSEECHTANYTLLIVGAPPLIINRSSTSELMYCIIFMHKYVAKTNTGTLSFCCVYVIVKP